MTQAKDLLKLIETVDHSDTAALDEIDARVWCWLNGKNYVLSTCGLENEYPYHETECGIALHDKPKYTRSLDALKAVQDKELEGWEMSLHKTWDNGYSVCLHFEGEDNLVEFECERYLPTMHLAWLYAIVCAMEYNRTSP